MSRFKPNARTSALIDREQRRSYRSVKVSSALAPELVYHEAPVPPASAPVEAVVPSGIQRIGFFALIVFLIIRFSYIHEVISSKLNVDTHLNIIFTIICFTCCVLGGNFGDAFRSKICWLWIGLTACMAAATVTSNWRGGSFPILFDYVRTCLPAVVMIPALAASKRDISRMISAIGVACLGLTLVGVFNSDFKTGRMSFASQSSDIQDSNDYAAHLILMLPALAWVTLRPGTSKLRKAVGVIGLSLAFYEILSTGSRGGLIAIAATTVYVAFMSSTRIRLAIFVGLPILSLCVLPLIPSESSARLRTLFSSSQSTTLDEEAVESREARVELLKESLRITMHHPLTGIGPGEFMDVQADQAKSQGERGMWHVTHNAYTQISSECGVPAFLCFFGGIVLTFVELRRMGKANIPGISLPCVFVSVMLLSFGVCIFFLSQGYTVHMIALSGIAIAARKFADEQPQPAAAPALARA